MSKTSRITPPLRFKYPWINKADTEFIKEGLFHVDGIGSGEEIEHHKGLIEAASKAALDNHIAEMEPGEAKKWSLYLPYEELEDEDGNPTGETEFTFKQNRVIRLKDGSNKKVNIEIRDSSDKVVDVQVFGGTIGRIMYSMRPIVMASAREVGVRLDFSKVQIIEMAERRGGGGFGAVEGGFEAPEGDGGEDEEQGGEY